jgi:hypothetical protein
MAEMRSTGRTAADDVADSIFTREWSSSASSLRLLLAAWPAAFRLLLVCVGILISALLLAFAFVPARWNAPGWPSYIHYGKNIEHAGLMLALLGVSLFVIFSARVKVASWGTLAWVLSMLAVVGIDGGGPKMIGSLVIVFLLSTLFFAWYYDLRDRAEPLPAAAPAGWQRWLAMFLMVAASGWLALTALRPVGWMDLHHHGEIIASSLDMLKGGIPYRTFFWPHGLCDTGVTALLMKLTGHQDFTVLALRYSINVALGLIAVYLLAYALIGDALYACIASLLVATVGGWTRGGPGLFVEALPLIIAFLVLSRGLTRRSLLGAGFLLGAGYLWRIDLGLSALVAAALYLIVDEYYVAGYARDGQLLAHLLDRSKFWSLVRRFLLLLIGVCIPLLICRGMLGFPTREWFRTTLIDMPRYHADSTGMPFPIGEGLAKAAYPPAPRFCQVTVPLVCLLCLGLFAFTLLKMVERKLPMDNARGRFFLLTLFFSLLCFTTALDRSDEGHLLRGTGFLAMLCLLDFFAYVRRRNGFWRATAVALVGCLAVQLLLSTPWIWLGWFRPLSWFASTTIRQDNLDALRTCFGPARVGDDLYTGLASDCAKPVRKSAARVREILDAHGVGPRELLVYHSAPLLYPMLGRDLPTQYYCLGWATNARMERSLIADLERNHVRAFLHTSTNLGGLPFYDVPDSHRIPLVDSYINSRVAKGKHYETAFGTLTIVEPGK